MKQKNKKNKKEKDICSEEKKETIPKIGWGDNPAFEIKPCDLFVISKDIERIKTMNREFIDTAKKIIVDYARECKTELENTYKLETMISNALLKAYNKGHSDSYEHYRYS